MSDQHEVTADLAPMPPSLATARFVFIARQADPGVLHEALGALTTAGLRHVEITLDSAGALTTISQLRQTLPGVLIGAGTVKQPAQVAVAADAGASFVVSPHSDPAIMAAATAVGVAHIPGAFTPTEVMVAWSWGVPLVKVFPIASLGAGFLRQLRGPCPEVRCIVTGGVELDNARAFVQAGAAAVGMGSELLKRWQRGTDPERAALVADFATLLAALEADTRGRD